MSANKTYTRELKDHLNYTATWLPNVKLALGSVGILSNYEFIYQTTLKNLGIPFQPGPTGPPADYSYFSAGAVSRSFKLSGAAPVAGSALAQADAGITFSFSKKNSIVFLASSCTIDSIADQGKLKQDILQAYNSGNWDPKYVVVSELVSARSTSVIIAEGSEARYELKAKADVAPSLEAMNVEGSFSLAHDEQIGFNFLARSGMTPLFRCLGVRTLWIRPDVVTRLDILQGAQISADPAVSIDEVEYDDFVDPVYP